MQKQDGIGSAGLFMGFSDRSPSHCMDCKRHYTVSVVRLSPSIRVIPASQEPYILSLFSRVLATYTCGHLLIPTNQAATAILGLGGILIL